MAKKLNELQRRRSDTAVIWIGIMWGGRLVVWIGCLLALVSGDVNGAGRLALLATGIQAVYKVLCYVYPRQYRTGAEWRRNKKDY